MIGIKSSRDIEKMRIAGRLVAECHELLAQAVRPGITTLELDQMAYRFIKKRGGYPTFLDYCGFPKSICTSINNEVIHGIPEKRRLREGDIISIDLGATVDGFVGDAARTHPVGKVSEEAQRLIDVTKQSFFEGIKYARKGYRLTDISNAVQTYIEANGFSVVEEYVGHGVGRHLHEDPEVPNFGKPGHGPRLCKGMCLAIEPMVNVGGIDVRVLSNDWTVVTCDGSLSAHYENTIAITGDSDPEILTLI